VSIVGIDLSPIAVVLGQPLVAHGCGEERVSCCASVWKATRNFHEDRQRVRRHIVLLHVIEKELRFRGPPESSTLSEIDK
jgi:hypothetical protein